LASNTRSQLQYNELPSIRVGGQAAVFRQYTGLFFNWCAGFGIEQVRGLAGLSISADNDCREVGDIARGHPRDVQTELAELKALERSLQRFVVQCDAVCCGGRDAIA
jgi:hypothetical protein